MSRRAAEILPEPGQQAADPLQEARLDLLIIGGGIAGLWTLNRALAAGYDAILLEKGELGGGQTANAQGIIHGGLKYTLEGRVTDAARALAAMPARWRRCLSGEGELDLSGVRVLSDATWLWSGQNLGGRFAALLGSRQLRSRAEPVAADARPPAFADPRFAGSLYRIDELVLDVPSLCGRLAAAAAGRIFRCDAAKLAFRFEGGEVSIALPEQGLLLRPSRVVLAAGGGFPELAAALRLKDSASQSRPLHMVSVRHRTPDAAVFGHFIAGLSASPRLTVTTYPDGDRLVWYLGGDLAEAGVDRDEAAQIAAARRVLAEALPWIALRDAEWAGVRIARAEPRQAGLKRPDRAVVTAAGPVIAAWPVKLALAPDLADQVLALLPPPGGHRFDPQRLRGWSPPPVAQPGWRGLLP